MRLNSLKTRLALQAGILTAAAVLVVGAVIYQALVQQELALQQASLKAAAGHISQVVERARADAVFATKLPPISGIIRTRQGQEDPRDGSTRAQWVERLQSIFTDLMRARPEYFQVRYIGLGDGGMELVRVDMVDGRPVPNTDLQRKGRRGYFKALAEAPPGSVYLSPINLNVERGRLEIPYRPTLRVGAPVFGPDGERFGMVVLNLELTPMFEHLAAGLPGNRSFYLTDESGEFLVHPDPRRTFGFAKGGTFRVQDEMPEVAAFMADPAADAALVELGGGTLAHMLRERFDPESPDRHLVLVETSDAGGLLSSAVSVRGEALQWTLLVAVVTGILGWVSAVSIVRPLDKLSAAARRLGSGQRDVTLDTGRGDELGELARGFADMTVQIADREAQVELERERLGLYLRHSPSALAVLDRELRYQIASDRWQREFGLEGEPLVGRSLLQPDAPIPDRWRSALPTCVDHESPASGEDGFATVGQGFEWIRWAAHPWYDRDGSFGGLVLVGENVSARKRAEQALRERTYQLGNAERIARVGNWIWEPASDRFTLSEESRELQGLPAGQDPVRRQDVLDAIHAEDRADVARSLDRLRDKLTPIALRYRLANGRTHMELIGEPERVAGNATGRLLGTWQDVTRQMIAEGQLRDVARQLTQSNRELEEFAYVASHDLQEPLRKIQAFGDRLRSKFADNLGEQGADYLRRMQDSAARMSRLINDLLDYSRVTTKAQPFAPVDLNALMGEVRQDLELTIEELGAELVVDDLPTVSADATQMRQLLQNLVGNALKYHRADVPPQVRVTGCPVPEMPAALAADIVYACIEVSDNGIGFEQTYAERIFLPFQRLHGRMEYQGTGIGLATCRKIVERHGGVIQARSTPGEGSVFRVVLPHTRPHYQQTEEEHADVA